MEQKTASGSGSILGGVMRIFAKSVRDAAGSTINAKNKHADQPPGSEKKIPPESSKKSLHLKSRKTLGDAAKDGTVSKSDTPKSSSVTRNRCSSRKSIDVAKRDSGVRVSRSLESVTNKSRKSVEESSGKENVLPKPGLTEDWSCDLLDVDACYHETFKTSDEQESKQKQFRTVERQIDIQEAPNHAEPVESPSSEHICSKGQSIALTESPAYRRANNNRKEAEVVSKVSMRCTMVSSRSSGNIVENVSVKTGPGEMCVEKKSLQNGQSERSLRCATQKLEQLNLRESSEGMRDSGVGGSRMLNTHSSDSVSFTPKGSVRIFRRSDLPTSRDAKTGTKRQESVKNVQLHILTTAAVSTDETKEKHSQQQERFSRTGDHETVSVQAVLDSEVPQITVAESEDWSTDLLSIPSSVNTSPEVVDHSSETNNEESIERNNEDNQENFVEHESKDSIEHNSDNSSSKDNHSGTFTRNSSERDAPVPLKIDTGPYFQGMMELVQEMDDDDYGGYVATSEVSEAEQNVINFQETERSEYVGFVDDISDVTSLTSEHRALSELDSQPSIGVGSGDENPQSSVDGSDRASTSEAYLEDFHADPDLRRMALDRLIEAGDHGRLKSHYDSNVTRGTAQRNMTASRHKGHVRNVAHSAIGSPAKLSHPQSRHRRPSSHREPLLSIPMDEIRTKESVEKLMGYISTCVHHREIEGNSVEFSVTAGDRGVRELVVGLDCGSAAVDCGPAAVPDTQQGQGYPWHWSFPPWPAYPTDPRYDPSVSPHSVNHHHAYYDRFYRSYPACYPYSYWSGVPIKMPTEDCFPISPSSLETSEQRIVDYDSSGDEDWFARLRKSSATHSTEQMPPTGGPQTEHPGRRPYASNKRYLSESLQPMSNKEKLLKTSSKGPNVPEAAGLNHQKKSPAFDCNYGTNEHAACGLCESDENERIVLKQRRNDRQESNLESGLVCPQRIVTDPIQDNSRTKCSNPHSWAKMRRNRNVVDSDSSFETERGGVVETVSEEQEVKSPGCYPYLTIGKLAAKSEKSEAKDAAVKDPPGIPSSCWASWATRTEGDAQWNRNYSGKTSSGDRPEHAKNSSSAIPESGVKKVESPAALDANKTPFSAPEPASAHFWSDPRISYPYPPFFPPQWMLNYPPSSPSCIPFPPPFSPSPTAHDSAAKDIKPPTTSTQSTNPVRYPCLSPDYTVPGSRPSISPGSDIPNSSLSYRSRHVSDYIPRTESNVVKNRRVSDSVFRTESEGLTLPKRHSSYYSRIQNDARLNANFPQLDWKIRFKNRCKNYGVNFIDSHCHLDFLYNREGFKGTFAKYKAKHEDTFPENFEGCVAVFCNPTSFTPYGGLWRDVVKESGVWLAMGCHPKNVTEFDTVAQDGLRKCILHPRVIAVGEMGLDYSGTFRQHEELQKKMFAYQLQLALDVKKPIVIHCRQAEDDCLAVMESIVPRNYKIHCHCFTGTFEQCQRWLTKFPNLFVGLTNLVSYRTATPTHEVARNIPLERLLLETDAPYFVPRGVPKGEFELSHPGMAVFVAEEVARLKGVPVAVVLKACRTNTTAMYGV